jgi:hypothetical protein
MNHQPYRDWLFEDTLDSSKADALHSHLETCVECRSLVGAFHQVEHSLHTAPLVAPTEGFTLRFQARLDAERGRLHGRQVRLALAFGIGGALVLLALLAILVWPLLDSLNAFLWAGAYQLYLAFIFVRQAGEFLADFAQGLALVLPLAVWVLALGLFSQAIVLWVVSYRYMTNPRRILT